MNKILIKEFEKQVKIQGSEPALITENLSISYKELDRLSNQLANRLDELGISEGDTVALLFPKGVEFIYSLFALLKIGATYLPLDTQYPDDRIKYLIKNSDAKCILSLSDNTLFNCSIPLIKVGDKELENYSKEFNLRFNNPNVNIYKLFTSGSTGDPKGVVIKNNGFMNLVEWYKTTLNLSTKDTVFLSASVSFDLAQKNIFAPLLSGSKLFVSEKQSLDYIEIADLIERFNITVLNWTPTALAPLFLYEDNFIKLSSIKYIVAGGEPLNLNHFKTWLKSEYSNSVLINTYGPTECTDVSNYYLVTTEDLDSINNVPIGKAIPNVELFINDNLDDGSGELLIGGIGVSEGYLNNEPLTKEKFIYNQELGTRLYKTGDFVKYDELGNYYFVGRSDDQVKINGFRIELGEIDSAISKFINLNGNHRTVKSVETQQLRVFHNYNSLDVDTIKLELKTVLPHYMIPADFTYIEEFPQTPNGKIDSMKLSQIRLFDNQVIDIEPVIFDHKNNIKKIWEDCLKRKVTVKSNFFELGGDSLKALILTTRLKKELQLEIQLENIFEFPVFEDFFKKLKIMNSANNTSLKVNSQQLNNDLIFEGARIKATKRLQESYMLTQKYQNSIERNQYIILSSKKTYDSDTIKAVSEHLYYSFDALRLIILENEGNVFLHEAKNIPVFVKTQVTDSLNEEEILLLIEKLVKTEFIFSKEPLFKVWHLKDNRGDKFIILTHHLVSDAQSLSILKKEFIAGLSGVFSDLSDTMSFKKYSEHINRKFTNNLIQTSEGKYWSSILNDVDSFLPSMPRDKKPETQTWDAWTKNINISSHVEDIRTYCSNKNITLAVFFSAIGNVVISNWIKSSRFIVNMQVNGRSTLESINSVGYFVNSVFWPVNFELTTTFSELLYNHKEIFLKILLNQDFPDVEIGNLIGNEVNPYIFYNYIEKNDDEIDSQGVSELQLVKEYSGEKSSFDIIYETKIANNKGEIEIVYRTDLYDESTAEYLSNSILKLLDVILYKGHDSLKVGEIIL